MESNEARIEEQEREQYEKGKKSFDIVLERLLTAQTEEERKHEAGVLQAIFRVYQMNNSNLKKYRRNAKRSIRSLQRAYEDKLRLLNDAKSGVEVRAVERPVDSIRVGEPQAQARYA